MLNSIQALGREGLRQLAGLGRMGLFFVRLLGSIGSPPWKFWPVLKQIQFIGSKSLFVISFVGAFSGMVLGLQGYHTLSKFGSEGLLGAGVALSLIREMGPVLAALMVTGRAGSAMCAELGIMRIDEQIDALECMAINPFSYLIAPKLVAALITLPLLTAIFDVVGIAGGYLTGVELLGVNPGSYWQGIDSSIDWRDIYMGIVKSFCFAILIIWICTYKGYYAGVDEGSFGPEEVSRATTDAVVLSSVAILVSDYVATSLLI
jgi:phospholipid/cholesterol/gamma-HCH transport system permease protein